MALNEKLRVESNFLRPSLSVSFHSRVDQRKSICKKANWHSSAFVSGIIHDESPHSQVFSEKRLSLEENLHDKRIGRVVIWIPTGLAGRYRSEHECARAANYRPGAQNVVSQVQKASSRRISAFCARCAVRAGSICTLGEMPLS